MREILLYEKVAKSVMLPLGDKTSEGFQGGCRICYFGTYDRPDAVYQIVRAPEPLGSSEDL